MSPAKTAKKKTSSAVSSPAPDPKTLNRDLLYSMLLQRRFEERTAEMYAIGKIGGFCHLYIGQEAISSGVNSVLRQDDYLICTYRDHGQALARGMTPNAVMAELFGRQDGCAKGKGGSMHMFDKSLGFLGGHGIVGGHIPIAAGVGFAIKYRGGDQVIACFMGEAAVNTGAFHEALNMAGLWKLPCIFIIENNKYGMGTAIERASSVVDLAGRGDAYAVAHAVVDGQDVLAVRAAAEEAIARARKDSTSTLLEIRTTRFMGHSMSDAASGTYRSKEELEANMKRDPINLHRLRMMQAGEITDAEYLAMDEAIKKTVQDSIDFADASPELPIAALMEDILVETTS
jgi:pyruvate dehydrogenase E1 component alpha subunit